MNRHYRGREREREPRLAGSFGRIAFSWLVTIGFVLSVVPVLGNKAGAFVLFVLVFPVIALLMLAVAGMGLLTLLNAVRGTGPRPGNLMFWLEALPAVVGIVAGMFYLATLKGPW